MRFARLLRSAFAVAVLAALTVLVAARGSPSSAETFTFKAAQAGAQTLDQGEGGGNPFASSLIEILSRSEARLSQLPADLRRLTEKKSGGFQVPDVPPDTGSTELMLVPPPSGERRIALVLVTSDYAKSLGAPSLPGAAADAHRVANALKAAGFKTEIALDLDLPGMKRKLAEFASVSVGYDVAVVYTTGHGIEVDGAIHLLPGDYPVAQGNRALPTRALKLQDVAHVLRARRGNLLFYGGCRDNPFGG